MVLVGGLWCRCSTPRLPVLGAVHLPEGAPQVAQTALHAARAAATGDVRQHGWALNYASNSFWRSGDPARAIELAREAVAPLRQAGDRDGHSQAFAGLVFTLRGAW